jgi:putative spermidine/putrescine transport system permease protein
VRMSRRRRVLKRLVPYLLSAPALVLSLVFIYGMVNGFLQGLGYLPYLGLTDITLDYVKAAFADASFMSSLVFSLKVSLVSTLLAVVGGVGLSAVLVYGHGGRLVRTIAVRIPLLTAHLLVVIFAVALLSSSGLIPRVLYYFGLIDSVTAFPGIVGDATGWGIIIVYVWKEVPFVAFLTYALMRQGATRFSEAAATLGASPVRGFLEVVLPLCRGSLAKAGLIVFTFSFGAYEVPLLLGPTLPAALPVLAYHEFSNPNLLNRPYAMAIVSIMAAVCLVAAVCYLLLSLREAKHRARYAR